MLKIKVGMIVKTNEDTIFFNLPCFISEKAVGIAPDAWWARALTGNNRSAYWINEKSILNARWPSKLERLVYNLARG